jgi:hypothetical protein
MLQASAIGESCRTNVLRIPFENPCTVNLSLKVCLVLSAPADRKLRFEEKSLAVVQ